MRIVRGLLWVLTPADSVSPRRDRVIVGAVLVAFLLFALTGLWFNVGP